jgi:hypothetical protein
MKDSRGFVSLLTTILLSLLLLIITISMVSLEALQLRKSEDAEQSVRAYYAAEAGVEDAVSKILSGAPLTPNTCLTSPVTFDTGGSSSWTCQQVSFAGKPSGNLDYYCPNTAVIPKPVCENATTVDPGNAAYDQVQVEWDQSSNGANFYQYPINNNPTVGAWNGAAAIELTIVQYPSGNFNSADVNLSLQNALVVPSTGPGQNIDFSAGLKGHGAWQGACTPNVGTYHCKVLLTNIPSGSGLNYLFRIRPRYAQSSFQMTFQDKNGVQVDVPDGMATIDVTAQAGKVYRRVVSKLPIRNGAAAGLNYVMYSDGNICKNFDVLNNVVSPGSVLPGC